MGTPLARRLRKVRRMLAQTPEVFELHQVLRLLRRAGSDSVSIVMRRPIRGKNGCVRAVTPARGRKPATVEIDSSLLPPDCDDRTADAVVNFMHDAWEVAHPYAAAEHAGRQSDAFIAEAQAFAGATSCRDLPRELIAHASACFRRRSADDLVAVCTEHLGVQVSFHPLDGGHAQLRVGPLTYAEYRAFLPEEGGGEAGLRLLAISSDLLGPAIEVDVVLILKASEVPPCIPGRKGAVVGITAWPRTRHGERRKDVIRTFPGSEWRSCP